MASRFDSGWGQDDYEIMLRDSGCAYFNGHSPTLTGEYVGNEPYDGAVFAENLTSQSPPTRHMIDGGYLHIHIERRGASTDLYGLGSPDNQTQDHQIEKIVEGVAFGTVWVSVHANARTLKSWEVGIRNSCKYLVSYARVYFSNERSHR